VANAITLLRILILFAIFPLVSLDEVQWHLAALFLTLLVIVLDGVDGLVARMLHQESEFGAVFDIAVDRIVENCFWVYFASRGVITVWVPLLVITRGFYVDGVRSVALAKGMTAFGSTSMQKSLIGRALVSSRPSRGLYGLAKVLSFLMLIVMDGLNLPSVADYIPLHLHHFLMAAGQSLVCFTVIFCLVRGLPVFVESWHFLFPRHRHE
jgi:CDP-diacylglycerol--glycerol-3-phosphate 3-phosphatidyltransferase